MLNADDQSSLPKSSSDYIYLYYLLMLNTDDESSLPKSKGRGKGQSGVQEAKKGTRTLSGETNKAVTTCTCTI